MGDAREQADERETLDAERSPASGGTRAAASGAGGGVAALQQAVGNAATARLLARVQRKVEVGPADDEYEREADALAHQVVTGKGAPRRVQRSRASGDQGGPLDDGTEADLQAASKGGRRLEAGVRRDMEDAFGADFGSVRIHDGGSARDLSERLSAKAFTTGSDIFFRDGAPDAGTDEGRELLAHELAHTVQQGSARRTVQRWPWSKKQQKVNPGPSGPKPEVGAYYSTMPDGKLLEFKRWAEEGKTGLSPEEANALMAELAKRGLVKPTGNPKDAGKGRLVGTKDVVIEGAKPGGVIGASQTTGRTLDATLGRDSVGPDQMSAGGGVAGDIMGGALLADAAMTVGSGYSRKKEAEKRGDKAGVKLGEQKMRAGGYGVATSAASVGKSGVDTGRAFGSTAMGLAQASGGLAIGAGAVTAAQGLWRGGKAAAKLWAVSKLKLQTPKGEEWSARVKNREKWKIACNALKVAAGALGIAVGVALIVSNPVGWALGIAAAAVGGAMAVAKIGNKVKDTYERSKATKKVAGREAEKLELELSKKSTEGKSREATKSAGARNEVGDYYTTMPDEKLLEFQKWAESGKVGLSPAEANALMTEISKRKAKKALEKGEPPKPEAPPALPGFPKGTKGAEAVEAEDAADPQAAARRKVKDQADEVAREFSTNARVAGEMRDALRSGAAAKAADMVGHVSPKEFAGFGITMADLQAYDASVLLGALNIDPEEALAESGQERIEKKLSVADNA